MSIEMEVAAAVRVLVGTKGRIGMSAADLSSCMEILGLASGRRSPESVSRAVARLRPQLEAQGLEVRWFHTHSSRLIEIYPVGTKSTTETIRDSRSQLREVRRTVAGLLLRLDKAGKAHGYLSLAHAWQLHERGITPTTESTRS